MDSIPATYEGGVFKPLQPVSLPEATPVDVTVRTSAESSEVAASVESDAEKLARRRAALDRVWRDLDALPKHQNGDGWSVANNADDVLYGGPDGVR
jgi:predicted DNA-binding antitoxin AbrB/MazE fold protein